MNHPNHVYINGDFVPRERAALHVDDLALQRGYGVFDFLRLIDGRPVFLDDHLGRFERSAERMRLPIGRTRQQLKGVLEELIARNGLTSSGVRLTLTGGYAADGYTIGSPNLIITQRSLPVVTELPAGIRLVSFEHQRQLCDVKTIDYVMAIWLRPFVAERGADDVLYHLGGVISECPRSNVFLVTADGRLVTPGRNVLKGVNRMHVLALARTQVPVEERDVRLEELREAREAFITSTTRGIVPVVAVDGHAVGDGRPGEATRWLRDALAAHARAAGPR